MKRMNNWNTIGYVTTNQTSDSYKKFQPSKVRQPSKPKRMESMQRSKSFEKIKISIQGRDNSKHMSSNQMDLSYERPSTPISKSNTSIHIMQHIASSHLIGVQAGRRIKRIKNKLELYVQDLKEEMRVLKQQVWVKNHQFGLFKDDIEEKVQKLVDNLNKQLIDQKQQLNDALYKISRLTHENRQLKEKIERSNRNNSDDNALPFCLEKKAHSGVITDTVDTLRQDIRASRSWTQDISGYRMKGLNQIQNTINQLKQIFVDPFQI